MECVERLKNPDTLKQRAMLMNNLDADDAKRAKIERQELMLRNQPSVIISVLMLFEAYSFGNINTSRFQRL